MEKLIRRLRPGLKTSKKGSYTETILDWASSPILNKQSRRRALRFGLVGGNLLLLLAIAGFVFSHRSASQTVRSSTLTSVGSTAKSQLNPLDQLSADQIAYQAALMAKLPELTIVRNRADSASALLAVVPNDNTSLAKPQVVSTKQKSRLDIITYSTKNGDTVEKLADRFHVSANSIRWSNDLNSDDLSAGTTLYIPPAEGIVYKVTAVDTVDTIVNRFQANRNTFITVNDAENGDLRVGELVWIPNAIQPTATATTAVTAGFTAPATYFDRPRTGAYYYTGPCESNGYDCGWCTWWAAHRYNQTHSHNLPTNLGDAYSWAISAQQQGMAVSHRPAAGAALQFAGRNHVGFVESVKGDNVYISEMNAAGFNVVSSSVIPMSEAVNYWYIY